MHVIRVSTSEDLDALRARWNALAGEVPFRTWQWLHTWWKHFGPHDEADGSTSELFTLCVYDDDSLIGIAPWYLDRGGSSAPVIRLLGSGDVCSDYLAVLALPEHACAVAGELSRWLAEPTVHGWGYPGGTTVPSWNMMHWEGADSHDATNRHLLEDLSQRRCLVDAIAAEKCWRIALPRTWEAYLNRLSKSHRKQMRRADQRILQTPGSTLHTVEHLDQLTRGLAILRRLHQKRHKSLGHAGVFACDRFARFLKEVSPLLLEQGQLRLTWLELDGQAVAVEYNLRDPHTIYSYQSGIEPELKHEAPGWLIFIANMQQAIQQGYQYFDLLRGDEPYKAHCRAEPWQGIQFRIAPDRPTARWRRHAWMTSRRIAHWITGQPFTAESLPPVEKLTSIEAPAGVAAHKPIDLHASGVQTHASQAPSVSTREARPGSMRPPDIQIVET